MAGKTATSKQTLTVAPPDIRAVKVKLKGTAPYSQARFSQKAMNAMMSKMDGTSKKGTSKVREARDFDEDYKQAMHVSTDGWVGMPASGLRAALISACRLTGFTMTRAKLSIFVQAEGYDKVDGQPLVQIHGKSERYDAAVRNATGVFDIRVRPLWKSWSITPTIIYDAGQFDLPDVLNLLRRAGLQVGLGEGRPDSRNSAGIGFGTFEIDETTVSESQL